MFQEKHIYYRGASSHFEVDLPLMSSNEDCFHGPSPDKWAGLMGLDKIGSTIEVGLPLMSSNKNCFHGPSPDKWSGLMGPEIGSNPYY